MGDHDIPAVTEYIIQHTGHKKIAYIGHSQGTTQLFYALSKNQDYFADKMSIFVALGPVTELTHIGSPLLSFVALFSDLIEVTC
jgi:pimeloyl-ACP methyl ester carboxylesterase